MGVTDYHTFYKLWQRLVNRAAQAFSTTDPNTGHITPMTPFEVLALDKQAGAQPNGTQTPLDVTGTGFTGQRVVDKTKTVSDISEGALWTNLNNSMTQLLGRAPTTQELRDFAYRVNQLAAANPEVQKTIGTYVNGKLTGANTVDQQGFNPSTSIMKEGVQEQANLYAKEQPDYGAYQAASTYYNATQQAVGAIGGNG